MPGDKIFFSLSLHLISLVYVLGKQNFKCNHVTFKRLDQDVKENLLSCLSSATRQQKSLVESVRLRQIADSRWSIQSSQELSTPFRPVIFPEQILFLEGTVPQTLGSSRNPRKTVFFVENL